MNMNEFPPARPAAALTELPVPHQPDVRVSDHGVANEKLLVLWRRSSAAAIRIRPDQFDPDRCDVADAFPFLSQSSRPSSQARNTPSSWPGRLSLRFGSIQQYRFLSKRQRCPIGKAHSAPRKSSGSGRYAQIPIEVTLRQDLVGPGLRKKEALRFDQLVIPFEVHRPRPAFPYMRPMPGSLPPSVDGFQSFAKRRQ